jgi:hypothetical protein
MLKNNKNVIDAKKVSIFFSLYIGMQFLQRWLGVIWIDGNGEIKNSITHHTCNLYLMAQVQKLDASNKKVAIIIIYR